VEQGSSRVECFEGPLFFILKGDNRKMSASTFRKMRARNRARQAAGKKIAHMKPASAADEQKQVVEAEPEVAVDFSEFTKKDLLQYIDENELDIDPRGMKKAELIAAIEVELYSVKTHAHAG